MGTVVCAILNGNQVYCSILADKETVADVKEACAIAGKLVLQQMVKHEFRDGDYRKQRTTWADGTVIEADLDTCEYTVR